MSNTHTWLIPTYDLLEDRCIVVWFVHSDFVQKKIIKKRGKFFVSEYYSSEVCFHNSKFHALDLILPARV